MSSGGESKSRPSKVGAECWMAWLMMAGVVGLISWSLIKHAENHEAGRKIYFICFEYGKGSDPRSNEYYKSGDYQGLVDWMEDEFDRYDQYVADLGGLDEIKKSGRMFRGVRCGFCELYCGLDFCVDYNAQFIPRNVELFLMLVHAQTDPYTPKLVSLFEAVSESDHPILKAYGLWFLKQAECSEFKVWDVDDMKSGQSYPGIEAFRDYIYECAGRGDAWSYGFAVDASRYDSDRQRAKKARQRFKAVKRSD